jgi:hypothetical protein
MAISELNHEKRSGAVRVTKSDASNKTYNPLLDKLGYLEICLFTGVVDSTRNGQNKWEPECGKRSTTSSLPHAASLGRPL